MKLLFFKHYQEDLKGSGVCVCKCWDESKEFFSASVELFGRLLLEMIKAGGEVGTLGQSQSIGNIAKIVNAVQCHS